MKAEALWGLHKSVTLVFEQGVWRKGFDAKQGGGSRCTNCTDSCCTVETNCHGIQPTSPSLSTCSLSHQNKKSWALMSTWVSQQSLSKGSFVDTDIVFGRWDRPDFLNFSLLRSAAFTLNTLPFFVNENVCWRHIWKNQIYFQRSRVCREENVI